MKSLADHDLDTLRTQLCDWGHRPSHASRILREFYATNGAPELSEREIGKKLRSRLRDELLPLRSRVIDQHKSADGTIKLLIGLDGGGTVESVLMPTFREGISAGCVSSQIGCAMGCDFCASTKNGFERNLTIGEIVEQFLHLCRAARATNTRLQTLVFMGMGEPLLNLDNVAAAIKRIADGSMGSLGYRQITVSTVGIVPGIERLRQLDLNVHLALSLHAPDDKTRSRLVPANKSYPVAQIMAAAKEYWLASGREVNVEYCVLAGVNDSDEQMRMLADLMGGFRAHVNLIPYNAIDGAAYRAPQPQRLADMLAILRDRGVVAHVRKTRGDDVNAACGQLRRRALTVIA
jgi:23S rRNA (adenine2503-C2)-methyltransferase